MPPTNRTRSRRAGVQETQNVGRLSVVAPSVARDPTAGATANALSSALGLATKQVGVEKERRDESFRLAGERDFNLGNVNDELRQANEAYGRALTQNETEAGWIADVDLFDEQIEKLDLDSVDPEEQLTALNASIDELYKQQYEGLEDPNAAEVLLPRMEEYRADKMNELIERQNAIAIEKRDADLYTVASAYAESSLEAAAEQNPDAREFELTAAGGFDYVGLQSRMRILMGGPETNEALFNTLTDLAIRNGDPGLLEGMPDRWPDGTPTIRNNPKFSDRLLNAERQAEAVRQGKESQYQRERKAQLEAEAKAVANQGYMAALDGVDPTAYVLEQVSTGSMDGKAGNSVIQAFRSSQTYTSNVSSDPQKFVAMQATILTDPSAVSLGDIYEAWASGTFGDPNQDEARQKLRSLIKDQEQAETALASAAKNPAAAASLERFKNTHSPKKHPITGDIIATPTVRRFYAGMLADIRTELAEGGDPEAIYDKYDERYRDRIKGIEETDQRGAENVTQVVANLVGGVVQPQDAIVRMRTFTGDAGIVRDLQAEVDAGRLSTKNYKALLMEMRNR